ncbi:MAG: hypothetical protein OWU32_08045 [Firmicutes bacterium]|nr:hypothetical protein [Bacillota bacterium]
MDWFTGVDLLALPVAFAVGRYSARFRFVRVKKRYKQNVSQFIRGR